jgi:hypothetical protein
MSGFLDSANKIIRFNKRKRIDKLKRVEKYIGTEASEATYEEATPEMLDAIKNRVQAQQKQEKRRTVVIFIIAGLVIAAGLYYALFLL